MFQTIKRTFSIYFLFLLTVFSSRATYPFPDIPAIPEKQWILNGTVYSSVEAENGFTYLGGDFTNVGLYTGSGLSLDSVTGEPIANFPQVRGNVHSIISDQNGGWYLGGRFDQIGKVIILNLAHLIPKKNQDGSAIYEVDPQFKPNPDGWVTALASSDEKGKKGFLYVAGEFNNPVWPASPFPKLVRFKPDGELDRDWKPNPQGDSITPVEILFISGSTLYVGGIFNQIAGNSNIQSLARFNLSGPLPVLDSSWRPQLELTGCKAGDPDPKCYSSGVVKALALSRNTLYVGGIFNRVSDKATTRQSIIGLAKFDLDKDIFDLAWTPNPFGLYQGGVSALTTKGNTLYVGGYFSEIEGNKTIQSLAKFDLSSPVPALDMSWHLNPAGGISSIVVADDAVYVGGGFSTIGGKNIQNLAKLDNQDQPDTNWHPQPNQSVETMAVGETLIEGKSVQTVQAGGYFQTVQGQEIHGLMRFKKDGTPDFDWKPNPLGQVDVKFSSTIQSLLLNGKTLYVGGNFKEISGNKNIQSLAKFDLSVPLPVPDPSWHPNPEGRILALAADGENLYVGGDFTKISDQPIARLAKFKNDSLDSNFDPKINDRRVNALAVHGGKNFYLYVGGSFTDLAHDTIKYPSPIQSLARFKKEGEREIIDSTWHPNPSVLAANLDRGEISPDAAVVGVNTLAVSEDQLVIGGAFNTVYSLGNVGEEPRKKKSLARFKNGVLDLNWPVNNLEMENNLFGERPLPMVNAALVSGSTLYIGGLFDKIGNQFIQNLAQFDRDGFLELRWRPYSQRTESDRFRGFAAVAVQSISVGNSALSVGGNFREMGSLPTGPLARFQTFVQFTKTSAQGDQQNGEFDLEVSLSSPEFSDVTVFYKVTGGTAKKGIDYQLFEGKLTIPAGETKKAIPLTILSNSNKEDLTVEVSLSTPQGALLGENKKFTYTIGKGSAAATSSGPLPSDDPGFVKEHYTGGCALLSEDKKLEAKAGSLFFLMSVGSIALQRKRFGKKSES